jgi:hypothetical protein
VNCSASITTGGTAQLLQAATNRRYLLIQNVSAGSIGISFTTSTPVIGAAGTITLTTGSSIERNSLAAPRNAIYVIGATTGQAITCVYQ